MLSVIYELLRNLPALIRLIKQLQKKQEAAKRKKLIKQDLDGISKACEDKDEQALRNIFNS